MKRPWQIWLLFLLCLSIVYPGLGWLTVLGLRLDRDETSARRQAEIAKGEAEQARQQAELQDLVGKALWRMDWVLTPFVAQEAARPEYMYRPFQATEIGTKGAPEHVPSPLLTGEVQYVLLHFQVASADDWSSPQCPLGPAAAVAKGQGVLERQMQKYAQRLAALRKETAYHQLLAKLPQQTLAFANSGQQLAPISLTLDDANQQAEVNAEVVRNEFPGQSDDPTQSPSQQMDEPQRLSNAPTQGPQTAEGVSGRSATPAAQQQSSQLLTLQQAIQTEFQRRNRGFQNYAQSQVLQQRAALAPRAVDHSVNEGVSRGVWIGSNLILARRVTRGKQTLVQGCWLDWDQIKPALLAEVRDLLPQADLAPAVTGREVTTGWALATLPVELTLPVSDTVSPGILPNDSGAQRRSALRLALVVAWCALILASGSVALLLHCVVKLSERRGAFVSAVTHELRTPLTTFRMYAEMLAGNMVPDPIQRQKYLETLRVEADRLSHLVDNVLQYARLERSHEKCRRQHVTVDHLQEHCRRRLSQRVEQAGMQWVETEDLPDQPIALETDPSAVEQILFNLVDNACKYAGRAVDQRVQVHWALDRRHLRIQVSDHGPGITPGQLARLFKPFAKSASEAAATAPGVGLGLSLCQRLANQLGGRLTCTAHDQRGATFRLELPLGGDLGSQQL